MDPTNHLIGAEPDEWFVVFHTKTSGRWLRILACGRFKHVSAFAYCAGFNAWLLYDTQLSGTRLMLLNHGDVAKGMIAAYAEDCVIVKITKRPLLKRLGLSSRLFFYCVPSIKSLIGVRCAAIFPDALYRHIIRSGGIVIDGNAKTAADPDHPDR